MEIEREIKTRNKLAALKEINIFLRKDCPCLIKFFKNHFSV